MNYKYLAFYLLVLITNSPQLAFSKCSKEDISFYLEKGFTQKQITQLCSSSGGSETPNYKPYQQQVIIYKDGGGPELKDGLTREERDAINELKVGGDVTKLKVTTQNINYSAKLCLRAANSPNVDQRFKICPEVDYVVHRKNLVVKATGKKLLFFGQPIIYLNGNIDRKLKRDIESYPAEFRRQLQRDFNWKENGEDTKFPLSGDYSPERVAQAFRVLSETYKENSDDEQLGGVDDEKPNEIIREPKNEKKKKWWNPFD